MRWSRSWKALAACLATLLLGLACGGSSNNASPAKSGPPLKIGVIDPFSGGSSIYGEELYRGNSLAVDEANAKGGVLARQIQLVKGDAVSADQGIQEATRLATQENVDLFTGTYISGVSKTASETAARYKKLYWDTNAVASELTERGLSNFIRSGPNAEAFATVSASAVTELVSKALNKSGGQLKVYLEHEDSIYGTSISDIQKAQLTKAGINVVGVGAHPASATDLTDSVLRGARTSPDVVLYTGYVPDVNLYLRTARGQHFAPTFVLVGTGDTKETLEALGQTGVEGILVTGYPRPDLNPAYGPGAPQYLAAYRKKYNQEPVAPQGMAAYVGMQILLQTIAKAGNTEPAKVRSAAASFDKPQSSYATGFGVKFDTKFQNTRAFPTVIQWQSGKQVTVYPQKAQAQGTSLVSLQRPS